MGDGEFIQTCKPEWRTTEYMLYDGDKWWELGADEKFKTLEGALLHWQAELDIVVSNIEDNERTANSTVLARELTERARRYVKSQKARQIIAEGTIVAIKKCQVGRGT